MVLQLQAEMEWLSLGSGSEVMPSLWGAKLRGEEFVPLPGRRGRATPQPCFARGGEQILPCRVGLGSGSEGLGGDGYPVR